MRTSGILMHISSLPSPYGIGTLGQAAYDFADFLKAAGQHYWQLLPIGPTSYGDSPYQSFSTHAGNPYFIDLDLLREDGLLTQEEIDAVDWEAHSARVDYGFQYSVRFDLLYRAFLRGWERDADAVREFRNANPWVEDYALYMALKRSQDMRSWETWPEEIRLRRPGAAETYAVRLGDDVHFFIYLQYLFFGQWDALRSYVHALGLEIIGDLPMYVARNSADVWANRHLFDLTEDGEPKNVAGVPLDYFSEFGQKWGNPLYNWAEMKKDGYRWWMDRLGACFKLFDAVRIDHFRAFSAYWAVPAEAETAKEGQWLDGPKTDFFDAVNRTFKNPKIIAEDLGIIDDGVIDLLKKTQLPCMRVMQFAFMEGKDNMHMPHNYPKNCVAYTGTHDNNTVLGWLWEAQPYEREHALKYCAFPGGDWAVGGSESASCHAVIRTLWQSPANTVIVPVQDLCGFGKDTKMNVPGVPNGNWAFRVTQEQLDGIDKKWLKELNDVYYRNK